MSPPSLWHTFRQILGRGLRETGQALDRLGVKTVALATTEHVYYDDPVIYEDHLSRHRQLFPLLAAGRPLLHPDVAFVAPCATLVGSVQLGSNTSVWYGAVLRGDGCEHVESHFQAYSSDDAKQWPLSPDRWRDQDDGHGGGIFIGNDTNLQDGCVVTARVEHTTIGTGVTVGHLAQIHSATIHDYCLIGMGSVVNEGVVIETETLIAAGAVIPAHTQVGAGELWVGNPARKIRDLTAAERERLHYQSAEYIKVAQSQRQVMELGGNVDPTTGASVYMAEDEDAPAALAGGEAPTTIAQIDAGTAEEEASARDRTPAESSSSPTQSGAPARTAGVTTAGSSDASEALASSSIEERSSGTKQQESSASSAV